MSCYHEAEHLALIDEHDAEMKRNALAFHDVYIWGAYESDNELISQTKRGWLKTEFDGQIYTHTWRAKAIEFNPLIGDISDE